MPRTPDLSKLPSFVTPSVMTPSTKPERISAVASRRFMPGDLQEPQHEEAVDDKHSRKVEFVIEFTEPCLPCERAEQAREQSKAAKRKGNRRESVPCAFRPVAPRGR